MTSHHVDRRGTSARHRRRKTPGRALAGLLVALLALLWGADLLPRPADDHRCHCGADSPCHTASACCSRHDGGCGMRGGCRCPHHGPAATTPWHDDATVTARPSIARLDLDETMALAVLALPLSISVLPAEHPPRRTAGHLAA